jgi:wyosine [tRNA(Phe)-imidazoG37] synthetase (radical SAM superfamily)
MMQLERSAVYGPVKTRRFGWDLGINLLPIDRKVCTFDCVYCQYGATSPFVNERLDFPTLEQILSEWQRKIITCVELGIDIQHTTLSGNGEPTMHPQFNQVVPELVRWRDKNARQIRLAILSNGYRLHDPAVRSAMQLLDEPVVKLDSGIPEKFQKINKPLTKTSFIHFYQHLRECRGLIIQTMFIKGWNDGMEDLIAWQNALSMIRPIASQIYTVTRDTVVPGLTPLSAAELSRIAADATRVTGVPVRAFVL